jgi:sortase A
MKIKDTQILLEQIALLFASFIWTVIVLAVVTLFWAYQDVQARWDYVLNAPPEALAQAVQAEGGDPALPPTATPSPSPTPWAGPPPTITPSPTSFPTPTATRVIPLPEVLPETLNADDPVPVIVHTAEELAELQPTQAPVEPVTIEILPTPTLEATPTSAALPTVEPPTPAPPTPEAPPFQMPLPTATATPAPPAIAEQPPRPAFGGEFVPSRLLIDSIGLDTPIVSVGWNVVEQNGQQYSVWQVADYAVGWHKTTAMLGNAGNTVMAGHHNVNGEVFRDLVNVEVGDHVTIYAGDIPFEYIVELKTIVKEKGEPVEVRQRNAQWIAPTNDERVTFVTCWPYTNNTHRVIVVAKPL